MSNVNPIPKGHEGVIAHIVVDGCNEAIEFYKKAMGAEEICRLPSPDGRIMHAEIRIGDAVVYLCDDFPEFCGGQKRNPKALGASTVTLTQYVKDCDAAIDRAVKAGATLKMPASDMFWGDRYGGVTDPYGHEWSFCTHIQDMTDEEITKAGQEMFAGGGCE